MENDDIVMEYNGYKNTMDTSALSNFVKVTRLHL